MISSIDTTGVGGASGVGRSGWQGRSHQARMDFEQLLQAMQAGNLGGAQQAYGAVQQALGADADGSGAEGVSGVAPDRSPLGAVSADWASLGQALQSGSLSSAQGAFSQLEQDAQAAAQALGGHPHHRHPSVAAAQAVYDALGVGAPSSGAGNQGVGADVSALGAALQSGDTSSAQALLAKLEQDLLASGQADVHRRHHHHQAFGAQDATAAYMATAVAVPAAPSSTGTAATA